MVSNQDRDMEVKEEQEQLSLAVDEAVLELEGVVDCDDGDETLEPRCNARADGRAVGGEDGERAVEGERERAVRVARVGKRHAGDEDGPLEHAGRRCRKLLHVHGCHQTLPHCAHAVSDLEHHEVALRHLIPRRSRRRARRRRRL